VPVHVSSTCAHHQEVKIALQAYSLWYHHTYMCDDTRGCVMQFWPPDDEHMCSKHVQARNKLIVKQKLCASSWLITEIKTQFVLQKQRHVSPRKGRSFRHKLFCLNVAVFWLIHILYVIYTRKVSMIKNRLMLPGKLKAVCCENHTNVGFLNFQAADIHSYPWALNG